MLRHKRTIHGAGDQRCANEGNPQFLTSLLYYSTQLYISKERVYAIIHIGLRMTKVFARWV